MKWAKSIPELFFGRDPLPDRLAYYKAHPMLSISITMRCSLQCPYCVSNMNKPGSQRDDFIGEMGIDAFLEKLYQMFHHRFPMQTSIPGTGEPTESPHFVPLLRKLLEWGNNVVIQTNLRGSPRLEEVLSSYSKEEVHKRVKIVTSYHLGTFLDRSLEVGHSLRAQYLFEHFPRAVKLGCNIVQVVTPMTPKTIRDTSIVEDYQYLYNLHPFQPIISELFHFYQGKTYPKAYTPEDRELLEKTRSAIFAVCKYDPHTFLDVPNKDQVKYSTAAYELKGMPCYKPTYHLDILATGQLRICQADPDWELGRFQTVDPNFVETVFGDNPMPCPANRCLCRSAAVAGCLSAFGVTSNEYYHAYYSQQGHPEIAKLFKVEKKPKNERCEEEDSL